MPEKERIFYHSKIKLVIAFFAGILLLSFSLMMAYAALTEAQDNFLLIIALFLIIVFLFVIPSNVLKLFRGNPYLIITDEYIRLDPYTKSEVTIYLEDIQSFGWKTVRNVTVIEINLYDDSDYVYDLSFHNKVRLYPNRIFNMALFTIAEKAVPRKQRPLLLQELKDIAALHDSF